MSLIDEMHEYSDYLKLVEERDALKKENMLYKEELMKLYAKVENVQNEINAGIEDIKVSIEIIISKLD